MRGTVLSLDGRLYVEYLTQGEEQDEVLKKQMKIVFTDQFKVSVGETIEFECQDFHTVDGTQLAKIK